MATITPNTTTIQDCDNERSLLAKVLHRLNLNSGVAVDMPSGNVAVTNTPLPIDFNGVQPVSVENQLHALVDNLPVSYPVTGSVAVSNFPATQNVAVTNLPTVAVQGATFQDGHMSVVNVPFDFEIAHDGRYLENGVFKTAFIARMLGRRLGFNSTSILQDVGEFFPGADVFPELTGVENLELVSSSAADASPGGTGTRTVRIMYLNTSYVLSVVTYALNGLTPVPVSEKMLFIYGMEAITGGTSEVGTGNIDLRIAGGGAIHERITAGGNRSLSAKFMVPDNYKAYLFHWTTYAIGQTMDVRLRSTVTSFDRLLVTRYIFQDTAYVGAGQNSHIDLAYRVHPARSKIKISCFPGGTGPANRIDASFSVLLVQD